MILDSIHSILDTKIRDVIDQRNDIVVDNAAFADFVRKATSSLELNPESVEKLRVDHLLLCFAAAHQNSTAIIEVRDTIQNESKRVSARAKLQDADQKELIQQIVEKLLVHGSKPPGILKYGGRSPLGRWLEATIWRHHLNELRGRPKERALDLSLIDALSDAEPEFVPLKAQYSLLFREAFADAVAKLDPEATTALRLTYLNNVNLAGLSKALDVSRATAHRRLVKARESLCQLIESHLVTEGNVPKSQVASLRRLVQSQVDLSISRLFSKNQK